MFTEQHYERIAEAIRIAGIENTKLIGKPLLVTLLCAMFAEDNERFDAERFARACYKEG